MSGHGQPASGWAARMAPGTFALTYDDGPGPFTRALADLLCAHGATATFFVVGRHVVANPEAIRHAHGLGHSIGNHTFNHPKLTELPQAAQIANEIGLAHECISREIAAPVRHLRAPFGAWNTESERALRESRMSSVYGTHVHWDIAEGDFMVGSPLNFDPQAPEYTVDQCVANYLQRMKALGRGVILLHDWIADPGEFGDRLRRNNRVLDLTERLLAQAEDCRFVTLDDLD